MTENQVEFKDLATGLVELSREYVSKLVLYHGDHIAEVAEFDRQLAAGELVEEVVNNGVTWSLAKYMELSSNAYMVFSGAVFKLTDKVLNFGTFNEKEIVWQES